MLSVIQDPDRESRVVAFIFSFSVILDILNRGSSVFIYLGLVTPAPWERTRVRGAMMCALDSARTDIKQLLDANTTKTGSTPVDTPATPLSCTQHSAT